MKLPGGITTIFGQSAQSRNEVPGEMARVRGFCASNAPGRRARSHAARTHEKRARFILVLIDVTLMPVVPGAV
jgi:hypothetical protein